MSSQSDLVTFHVTCNNKQAAIEFDTRTSFLAHSALCLSFSCLLSTL